jgi:hypothetical protein
MKVLDMAFVRQQLFLRRLLPRLEVQQLQTLFMLLYSITMYLLNMDVPRLKRNTYLI